MAPFSSIFTTSVRRTWASSLRTVVARTQQKRGGLRANWRVWPRLTMAITHSDTPGMVCQASARLARGLNSFKYWLHKGRMLIVGRKWHVLSFWKCMCFILSAITAVGHLGAKVGPWGTRNTLFSGPSAERGDKRHIRGCLQTRAPPFSAWLIRSTSEALYPRLSWAVVLGTLVRGSIVLSVSALYPGDFL